MLTFNKPHRFVPGQYGRKYCEECNRPPADAVHEFTGLAYTVTPPDIDPSVAELWARDEAEEDRRGTEIVGGLILLFTFALGVLGTLLVQWVWPG